ncbi:hypothetical protein B0H17DRAFT_115026 [Mycena rosella]|uniref:Uncharacterized protein n=1 Tax=Mycena rosella TaxID=1033263 RepID=A0AAD7GCV3_MYCRO|nr:hypothetical protein B0H17DRAFT_115026 [Mycena rosella]
MTMYLLVTDSTGVITHFDAAQSAQSQAALNSYTEPCIPRHCDFVLPTFVDLHLHAPQFRKRAAPPVDGGTGCISFKARNGWMKTQRSPGGSILAWLNVLSTTDRGPSCSSGSLKRIQVYLLPSVLSHGWR